MKLKYTILIFGYSIYSIISFGQQSVGIGTNSPNTSSLLEINSNSKGILIPRVSLTGITDITTIPSPVNALLVYNNNPALPDGRGFYYYNTFTNEWTRLATNNNLNNISYWSFSGNNGTDPAVNFIGTTDNKALVFKTNNILSGKIDPGPNNVFFGQSAGVAITTGTNNTFIGHLAGQNNNTGSSNLFVGHFAGNINTSGIENVFLGQEAGKANTIGERNVFIGEDAGVSNTTGDDNIYIGNGAGRLSTTAFQQVAIGSEALASVTTGDFNTAIGYLSSKEITTGSYNTAVGAHSSEQLTSGLFNTAIGRYALQTNISGSSNTALGINAGFETGFTDLDNTVVIGAEAKVSQSETMVFGRISMKRWAFGLSTPGAGHALEVGSANTNGNGAYLTQGGTWTNASDVNKKEDFSILDGNELLQKISSLPITKWKYKGSDEYHIGPMAQDFYKLFDLGTDDKGISTVDPAGIALAAIQELIKENTDLKKRIEKLEGLPMNK
ncbi:MAG: tail fiber domain-containing protein [Chitinophagaceae bacterium]